jgi:hypothetical protein
MEYEQFTDAVQGVASKETSADPDEWTLDNPLWGHCAVVALLAQDLYGGELVRGALSDIPKYAHLRSHYWNRIDSAEIDFTAEQYSDLSIKDLVGEARERNTLLEHPDTVRRYRLLKSRFNKD